MQMIAVEQFIEAVKRRPALWDSHSEDYKDRVMKKDGWLEVCQIMCPKFADKTEQERAQIGRDIQLKWKNLRDAYVRHIRMKMDRSKKSKPIRSYIYYNQMSFLRRVINPRARSGESRFGSTSKTNVKVEEDEEEAELTQEDLLEMVEHDENSEIATPGLDEEEELITNVDPLLPEVVENELQDNDDMNFFKSLLPTLQTLRTEQKLKFRIDVMELLMTYHQATSE
ncbi:uncharacterized protein LOC108905601 [Anoplophora glabripennis]|uniref:uncharacterized protein LOC108905601 n=1 Tax=Anoplophora glabripennis TaxID=217634 RepID=UPI000874C76B|nr:uncharacterized protein LOC108905601 [Anoplophora glabripennis]